MQNCFSARAKVFTSALDITEINMNASRVKEAKPQSRIKGGCFLDSLLDEIKLSKGAQGKHIYF